MLKPFIQIALTLLHLKLKNKSVITQALINSDCTYTKNQQHYLKTCYSQCYRNRHIVVESTIRYLYRPLTVIEPIFTELVLDRQVLGNKFYVEFYENTTNNLGICKGLPQQAEVAQGAPSSLRPRIFLTFGTTGVVGR
jgi:hypothetical protein